MADDDDFVRITLRIPTELHAQLNAAAAKKRSMNAEIIERLEQSVSGGNTTNPKPFTVDRFALSDSILLRDAMESIAIENKSILMNILSNITSLRNEIAHEKSGKLDESAFINIIEQATDLNKSAEFAEWMAGRMRALRAERDETSDKEKPSTAEPHRLQSKR